MQLYSVSHSLEHQWGYLEKSDSYLWGESSENNRTRIGSTDHISDSHACPTFFVSSDLSVVILNQVLLILSIWQKIGS